LRAKVLGRLGWTPSPSSKSVCSILPLARHLRAGELFSASTPARTSLLKPAADQQVQPPHNGQGAYHRQRCEYPEEEHSASMHSPLSLAVGYNSVVTQGGHSCNNVVAILAKDKTSSLCSRCSTPASILSSAARFASPFRAVLRFAPSQCPKPSSAPVPAAAHNTRRDMSILSVAVLALSGRGYGPLSMRIQQPAADMFSLSLQVVGKNTTSSS
jgi:hypothetical protein